MQMTFLPDIPANNVADDIADDFHRPHAVRTWTMSSARRTQQAIQSNSKWSSFESKSRDSSAKNEVFKSISTFRFSNIWFCRPRISTV